MIIKGTNERWSYELDPGHSIISVSVDGVLATHISIEDINRIANVLTHLWNIKESEKRIAEISNPKDAPEF